MSNGVRCDDSAVTHSAGTLTVVGWVAVVSGAVVRPVTAAWWSGRQMTSRLSMGWWCRLGLRGSHRRRRRRPSACMRNPKPNRRHVPLPVMRHLAIASGISERGGGGGGDIARWGGGGRGRGVTAVLCPPCLPSEASVASLCGCAPGAARCLTACASMLGTLPIHAWYSPAVSPLHPVHQPGTRAPSTASATPRSGQTRWASSTSTQRARSATPSRETPSRPSATPSLGWG